jgi:hypothetical protein
VQGRESEWAQEQAQWASQCSAVLVLVLVLLLVLVLVLVRVQD